MAVQDAVLIEEKMQTQQRMKVLGSCPGAGQGPEILRRTIASAAPGAKPGPVWPQRRTLWQAK
jgi:hypothetical protein